MDRTTGESSSYIDNTNRETISAFRFHLVIDSLVVSVSQDMGWLCNFQPKYPQDTTGLSCLLNELFYIGMPVVQTDRRLVELTVNTCDYQKRLPNTKINKQIQQPVKRLIHILPWLKCLKLCSYLNM